MESFEKRLEEPREELKIDKKKKRVFARADKKSREEGSIGITAAELITLGRQGRVG